MLDFANTVYRREPELGDDLLDDPAALVAWLARTRLLSADGVDADPAQLGAARALRAGCWAVFDAQREGRPLPSEALAGLVTVGQRGVADVDARPDGSMTARSVDGALAALALRAVAVALRPLPHPVRACDRCGWFFVDSSRSRRRRWCSMQTCGNQAKAARHRSAR